MAQGQSVTKLLTVVGSAFTSRHDVMDVQRLGRGAVATAAPGELGVSSWGRPSREGSRRSVGELRAVRGSRTSCANTFHRS
jgi:hypothetical protein